jgi:hypothetical protein
MLPARASFFADVVADGKGEMPTAGTRAATSRDTTCANEKAIYVDKGCSRVWARKRAALCSNLLKPWQIH